jgi:hypothetical protein
VNAGLRALTPYARQRPALPPRQRCELCGVAIGDEHRHVVDLDRRALQCACAPCGLLFDQERGRYRRVPQRVLRAPPIAAARWAALGAPVQLAFVFFNSRLSRWCASYPGVAGAIEAEIPADQWADLDLPVMEPDVEALLVWGPRGASELECFVAPIDACYELAGLCRTKWRGFQGGDEVHREIDAFFARLRSRAG